VNVVFHDIPGSFTSIFYVFPGLFNRVNIEQARFSHTLCGNKKDPTTKTSISSKQRNSFICNFQQLLRRKFATDSP